jgi:hypothetical protein
LQRGLLDGRPHLIVLDGLERVQEEAGGGRVRGELSDHTLKLFEIHGMTNVSYWNLADDQTKAKSPYVAGNTLIYLLTHKSIDAAKASFDAIRADPVWVASRAASEKKAGGSLTVKDGVKSEFLVPTDYSPLR